MASSTKSGGSALAVLQRLGRSLMLPIATLPAAALLLRLGQDDLLGPDGLGQYLDWMNPVAKVVGAAGGSLFDNLPILFAVGIAFGFAKKGDGSAAVAGLVGYLVFHNVSMSMFADSSISDDVMVQDAEGEPLLNLGMQNPTGVLGGVVIGIVAALLWQRFHRIKLPTWLSFFGGRRFVPIVTAVSALLLAVLAGFVWPAVSGPIDDFGNFLTDYGAIGAGIYGVINRLLLPFGLHHILNSVVWFTVPNCEVDGQTYTGDLNCYFQGVEGTGTFMAGFFPIMMFAMPAVVLAFYVTARPENKKTVASFAIATGVTSFVTGITEPIEFAFIFIAPLLLGVHAVLTGVSLFLADILGVKIGFGFSAGAIDYVLNFTKSNTENPLGVVLIGLIMFAVYFLIFTFLIKKLNLPTPGREALDGNGTADDGDEKAEAKADKESSSGSTTSESEDKPKNDKNH
ncbi:PTS transporter subunit EIIC [Haloglycomyces albus]|uniref:PTS transporter subunit EIIC n=1 Tax=Haloglycomyces albus TaxID=526067 RepID=UPI0004A3E3BE|nr:PTS transporter subunit EIIC [Haloglycomyces albus]